MRVIQFSALAVLLSWTHIGLADELVTWDNRQPIKLTLNVGEERAIVFPANVQVGMPPEIASDALRTQSVGGVVYWKPSKAFQAQRVYVRLVDSGHIVLFDLAAEDPGKAASAGAAKPEPMRVLFPDGVDLNPPKPLEPGTASAAGVAPGAAGEVAAEAEEAAPVITPVMLVRFAAQQLYAPQRLLRDLPGISRVPMRAPKTMTTLYRGGEVAAKPVASWVGGGYYVTAVKLINQTGGRVQLDPRRLKGDLRYAAFQHASMTLGPKGSETDTTSVYLVTERPFADTVL